MVNSGRPNDTLLKLYNDVCYICTSVIVEQKPEEMIDYYWDIAGKKEEHPLFDDGFNKTRANVVYGIISCIADYQTSESRPLLELLEAMDKKADGKHREIRECLMKECHSKGVSFFSFPAEELFMPRPLSKRLLESICLRKATGGFNEKCIEELICKVGKNLGADNSNDRVYMLLDALEDEVKKAGEKVPNIVYRIRGTLDESKKQMRYDSLAKENEMLLNALHEWRVKCEALEKENVELKEMTESQKCKIKALKAREPKIEGITATDIQKGFESIETPDCRRKARTEFMQVLDGNPIWCQALKAMKKDGIFDDPKPVTTPAFALNLELVGKKETNIDKNYGPNIEHNGGTLTLPDNNKEQ